MKKHRTVAIASSVYSSLSLDGDHIVNIAVTKRDVTLSSRKQKYGLRDREEFYTNYYTIGREDGKVKVPILLTGLVVSITEQNMNGID